MSRETKPIEFDGIKYGENATIENEQVVVSNLETTTVHGAILWKI
jgi:hypothetical protein